jgi:uncharacterized membrane protein
MEILMIGLTALLAVLTWLIYRLVAALEPKA